MLEKPALEDEKIVACLRDQYGLSIAQVEFLPLGADANTAVYRVISDLQTAYFLKLRSGVFDEMSVLLPHLLHEQGIRQIIDPMITKAERLYGNLDTFSVILYPFIEGKNGFDVRLSDAQWVEFGRALKRIHSVNAPSILKSRLLQEYYSPTWLQIVREFQAFVEATTFADPISTKLAALIKSNRPVIDDLIKRTERLDQMLRTQVPAEYVICHSDIHAGNLLIPTNGNFYIVDWDAPILAPKERDLMFIGGGIGKLDSPQEEALFYQGYGQTPINFAVLAYYRYERIIEDIAAYCREILVSDKGDLDREEGLRRLSSAFQPNAVIDIAYRTDRTNPMGGSDFMNIPE